MRINHNIAALNTYRQLGANTVNAGKNIEKLSSGLRINRAGDDAAGLAISEKMRAQVRGLDQATRNASDSISMIQTAEGALNETHSILQRMRELAVQASNDTNTADDRNEMQKEINQLSSEINRIGSTTEFNTIKMLNGEMTGRGFAGGASTTTAGGVTLGINGTALTVGANELTITKTGEIAGASDTVANVDTTSGVTYNSGGASAVFSGGSITVASGTDTVDWTLTYTAGTAAATSGFSAGTTGLTLTSGTDLSGGSYTVDVTRTQVASGTAQTATNSDLSGTGSSAGVVFAGNTISSITDGSTSGSMTVDNDTDVEFTLTYDSGTDTFTVRASGTAALLVSGTVVGKNASGNFEFSDYGLSGTITDIGALADGETLKFTTTANSAGTSFDTAKELYNAANTGGNNWTMAAGITSDATVVTANWTIEIVTSGVSGTVRISNDLASGVAGAVEGDIMELSSGLIYNQNGIHFEFTGANGLGSGAVGDEVNFTTTAIYDYTVSVTGDSGSSYSDTTTYSGVASGAVAASGGDGGLSGLSGGLSLTTAGLQVGTATFNVDAATDGSFTLAGTDISGNAVTLDSGSSTVAIGVAYAANDLSFTITSGGTLASGDTIDFSVYEKQKYTVGVSLNGGTAVEVSGLLATDDITTNSGISGLNFSSASGVSAITAGDYTVDVESSSSDDTAAMFQIGANQSQQMALNISDMRSRALGITTSVAGTDGFSSATAVNNGTSNTNIEYALDVTSSANATSAITVLDSAISSVSAERSKLGSYQNRLEHTINNLGAASENLTAAESRIRDVDMAKEMMEFTKNNILSQAAQSMMAQANQQPQGVLQLLR